MITRSIQHTSAEMTVSAHFSAEAIRPKTFNGKVKIDEKHWVIKKCCCRCLWLKTSAVAVHICTVMNQFSLYWIFCALLLFSGLSSSFCGQFSLAIGFFYFLVFTNLFVFPSCFFFCHSIFHSLLFLIIFSAFIGPFLSMNGKYPSPIVWNTIFHVHK